MLVAQEINRILNPRWVIVALGLMFGLIGATYHNWNVGETNRAFIASQQRALGELTAQERLVGQLEQQTRLLAAIAEAVGAEQIKEE